MLRTGTDTTSQTRPDADAGRDPIVLVPAPHEYPQRDRPNWLRTADSIGLAMLLLAWAAAIYPQTTWSPFYPRVLGAGVVLVFLSQSLAERVMRSLARRRARSATLPSAAQPSWARLLCYGEPAELRPLAQLPKWEFEPVIVKGLRSSYRKGEPFRRSVLATVGILLTFFVCLLTFLLLVSSAWMLRVTALILLVGTVSMLRARANALYYRIGPQRLEVLSCAFPRCRLRMVDSVDVSRARIVCWYPNQVVSITPGRGDDRQDRRISLQEVHEPHRLVEGLFRAARSARGPIPLPADEFLG